MTGFEPPTATDCYRFSLSNENLQVAIAGPKDEAQTRDAIAAFEKGPMDEEELSRMRTSGDHVHGIRSFSAMLT